MLLLLLTLAAACTRDDAFDDTVPGNATPAAALTITVTDGAYTSATEASADNTTPDGTPTTRAVDNGYATEFTKGDQIGLYAAEVTKNANGNPSGFEKMLHTNLCLTYDGTTWTLPSSTELKYNPSDGNDILYFAYYPYQADAAMESYTIDGLNAGAVANTAVDFFHDLIGKWKPRNDQSTYADYTSSDLMVARGKLATRTDGTPGSLLSFTMQHQMQLNIIQLPGTRYNYKEKIQGVPISKSCDHYIGAHLPKLWREDHYTARYITNPLSDVNISNCSYYNSDLEMRRFDLSIPLNVNLRGKYKLYTINGGEITVDTRPLTEGDFYMKDGGIIPGDKQSLPNEVKADCIGVVFWVGEKNSDPPHWEAPRFYMGDYLLMNDHPECIHGMVVALKDASPNKISWCSTADTYIHQWGRSFKEFTAKEQTDIDLIYRSSAWWGYSRNCLLRLYKKYTKVTTDAADAIVEYAKKNQTPYYCSGWFFPGHEELLVMAKDDKLNAQLEKAGGDKFKDDFYWSCTEYVDYTEIYCHRLDKGHSFFYDITKTGQSFVRAILAF